MQTQNPQFVRDAITRGKISKAEIARRADIHANSLTGVEYETWNPKWHTLCAICRAIEEIKRERA